MTVPGDAGTVPGDAGTESVTASTHDQAAGGISASRIARAFGIQFVSRLIGTVASVFTVALTTRHLGVNAYGILTSAIIFVALWSSLTELGIGATIVRRVNSGEGDLKDLVAVNAGLSIIYCIPLAITAAISGFLVYSGDRQLRTLIIVVSASLILTTLSTCYSPVYLVTVQFRVVAIGDLLSRVGSLGATIVVLAAHGGLVWFAVVQLVPPLVQLVVLAGGARRLISLRPRFSMRDSRHLIRESLPQTGVLIIGVLYWRADGVILTVLSKPAEVGAYGLAYNLAFTTAIVSTFFLSSTLSAMTATFAADREGFARFISSTMQTMLFLGVPIAVVGGVLAHAVVTLIGSAGFAAAAGPTLTLLCVGVALTFLTGTLSQALFAAHEQVFLLRLNIVNLLVNIILNIVLIPHLGAVGAGIALLVSELSGLIVVSIRLRHRSSYRTPFAFLLRLTPSAVAAAATAYFLREGAVIAVGALACCVYVVTNLIVGPVRVSTIRRLSRDGAVV